MARPPLFVSRAAGSYFQFGQIEYEIPVPVEEWEMGGGAPAQAEGSWQAEGCPRCPPQGTEAGKRLVKNFAVEQTQYDSNSAREP